MSSTKDLLAMLAGLLLGTRSTSHSDDDDHNDDSDDDSLLMPDVVIDEP